MFSTSAEISENTSFGDVSGFNDKVSPFIDISVKITWFTLKTSQLNKKKNHVSTIFYFLATKVSKFKRTNGIHSHLDVLVFNNE